MGAATITLPLAFLAGLVSFLSPCCLPLVPTYVTFLTGGSFDELTGELTPALRRRVIVNALAFILGFSAIFVALGLGASSVGQFFRENLNLIRQLSGIVVIAFALQMMGLLRFSFLEREVKAHVTPGRAGLGKSFLIGATFSAGWSPCVGPVLTAILLMAAQSGSVVTGGVLLATYSLGLAVPFFLTALSLGWLVRYMPRIGPYLPRIRFASGLLLLAVGIMIYTGTFVLLNRYFNFNLPI